MRLLFPLAVLIGALLVACSSSVSWVGRDPDRATLPSSRNPVFAKAGLIEITEVDSSIAIDLRYTRESAIARRPLYQPNMVALLRPETAVRLKKANDYVKQYGYRIKVWDAYRPPEAQLILWEASGHDDRFVANPHSKPSQHSCGTAVDVTLVTRGGAEVKMPTGFDSFTPQAAARYVGLSEEVEKRRDILQRGMLEAGFYLLPNEWWHFTDRKFRDYPSTIGLSEVEAGF